MSTLGQRIKQLREQQSLTQKELAEILDVTVRTIQYVESDKRNLDNANLIILADYFGVSLDYLTGRSDELPPDLYRWLQVGKNLTLEQRELLVKTIDKLTGSEPHERQQ
ncbi:helix-turn-helix transcriptional regulator [Hazenella sp. IB182357]|uniref:Helix-turn-helix transcriptional regulator n=1 Tax=Polycladospora coralii TaxID=2771432 RepID=A0A926RVI6_9BACL|nr:helix-turn-helix transcriptional regulator [Polycladospora coralii]MBD1373877.1 helix-turn-helix transcriptional regulator [Polycladospora coralii]